MSEVTDYWKPELEKAQQTIERLSFVIAQYQEAMEQAREASKDLVKAAKTLTKALDRQYKNKPPPCFSSQYEENEWLKEAIAQLDATLGRV